MAYNKKDFKSIGDIFDNNKKASKPPAYKWQDLALEIINDLNIPSHKKSSVFKVCRDNYPQFVKRCWNDTKELCDSKEKWRYFFKVVNAKDGDKEKPSKPL